jgi:sensor histidine kinase YesM
MPSWMDLVNYTFAVSGLIIVFMGFLIAVYSPYMDSWNHIFLKRFFLVMVLYISSDLLTQVFMSNLLGTQFMLLSKSFLFLENLFASVLMPMLTIYLLHCANVYWKSSRTLWIAGGLWLIYFILLIVCQFTTEIYYFTADNVYHRGNYFALLLLPPTLLMLLNIFALFRKRKKLTSRLKLALLIYLVLPTICIIIETHFFGLLLIVIGTSIAALFLLLFIQREQMEQYWEQQKERSNQRARIMILQMRPHFIYNTMTSIYYLCEQDPKRAQEVILDFNNYLRRNFTALAREDLAPFSDELEHAKAYLKVEQVRFEGKIFVEYDTPYTDFSLPPLTLQPIVENAVKHGVDPELDPLHILIKTCKTPDKYQVIVEDNGPGFSSENQTGFSIDGKGNGIALGNISERLKLNCNGSLTFTPRKEGGTIVTIEVERVEPQ